MLIFCGLCKSCIFPDEAEEVSPATLTAQAQDMIQAAMAEIVAGAEQTLAAQVTNTPIPTHTSTPTNTPIPPTNTPIPPTDTPVPSPTPHGGDEPCSTCHNE